MSKFLVLILSGVLSASLAGCASTATTGGPISKTSDKAKVVAPAKSESVMMSIEKANALYAANKPDEAAAELNRIAAAYPTNKSPWLRMAQVSFDAGTYSDAIIKAQEVLKRDSQDKVANSIIVVSGLRLAVKSLSDLRTQNEVTPSLKNDAEELAKTLRESLGENSLLTKEEPAVKPSPKPKYKKKVTTTSTQDSASKASDTKGSKSGDPFGDFK